MVKKKRLKPSIQIIIGFLLVILTGSFLLSLPISNKSGQWLNFTDSFFTSTSAVCVTGLTVFDISLSLTLFGQIVLLILIQIGGLGLITLTALVFLMLGKKITFESRLTLKESLNQEKIQGVVKFVKRIIIFVFSIELIGAICFLPSFVTLYGWGQGIFKSIFLSISSFCNAGFDVLATDGQASLSLSAFSQNALVLLPTMFLITIGGIGFLVLFDIPKLFKGKKLLFHTKVVLLVTSIIIFGGAILFGIFEWNNANSIGNMSFGNKILNCLFFSITPRTAGFFTINPTNLSSASLILTDIIMFIGGSPTSTAGGIKTTTFFILLLVLIKNVNFKGDIVIRKRRIKQRTIHKAAKILCLHVVLVLISTISICAIEGLRADVVLFETISAISTVGLSLNLTTTLGVVSKFIVCILMFIGRVGAITITLALGASENNVEQKIEYTDSKIVVG
ncbi:MAG: Trk family potassium uptake protein [Clostridia bacterium]|nr:Trk family potassium uptake protein [Clostridia bacterium]